jgi:hypothetical protein
MERDYLPWCCANPPSCTIRNVRDNVVVNARPKP